MFFNFNNIHVIHEALVALKAKEDKDPRYDTLVEKLMERMSWSKEEVEQGIRGLVGQR